MTLDNKKLQAKHDTMSRAKLEEAEQDLLHKPDMVALAYIKKRLKLSEAEPSKIRRNTFLALALVVGLSLLLIAAAFIVPPVSAWLRTVE